MAKGPPNAELEAWALKKDVGIPVNAFFLMVGCGILYMFVCGLVHIVFQLANVKKASAQESLATKLGKSKQFWFRSLFLLFCVGFGMAFLVGDCSLAEKTVVMESKAAADAVLGKMDTDGKISESMTINFKAESLVLSGRTGSNNHYGWELAAVGTHESNAQALYDELSTYTDFPVEVTFREIAGIAQRSDGMSCKRWHMLLWYSVFLILTTTISITPKEFFLGEGVGLSHILAWYLRKREYPKDDYVEVDEAARSYGGRKLEVGFWTLMPSAFITWIFAKSIHNASVLGGRYGILGGLGYATWYLSFLSAAIVGYVLRTRFGYKSLPEAINRNYGPFACLCFMFCCMFRLFNEVWSNATVIGELYGPQNSSSFWGAAWFGVLVPGIYVFMGGMRSSLLTDCFQAGGAVLFLIICIIAISADNRFKDDIFSFSPSTVRDITSGGEAGWEPGFHILALGGILQGICSYPFFDPVLTDRAFLSNPKTMFLSLSVGGTIAALFITFYGALGVYGAFYQDLYTINCGCTVGPEVCAARGYSLAPGELSTEECSWWAANQQGWGKAGGSAFVGTLIGYRVSTAIMIFQLFVYATASMSTLDSTFSSAAKLIALEFCGWLRLSGDSRSYPAPLRPHDSAHISSTHLWIARVSIFALMFCGLCFLGFEKDAMSATTAAGTCIMGIGFPIWMMLFMNPKKQGRKIRRAPLAFVIPFIIGWFFGMSYWADGSQRDASEKRITYDDFPVGNYEKTFDCAKLSFGGCDKPCTWIDPELVDGAWTAGGCSGPSSVTVLQKMYYARFFGTNLIGHCVCLGAFIVFFFLHQLLPDRCLQNRLVSLLGFGELTPPEEAEQGQAESLKAAATEVAAQKFGASKLDTDTGKELESI
mmetsp:Transcript_119345/g.210899  ORF Transcript_119345/g.210899 Transcript_119345/m.210899 type:complete len:879 (-) Transcript_119345:300-2936(-)